MKTAGLVSIALVIIATTSLALDPPPGGGYPAETTALGDGALFSEVNGDAAANTAVGFQALYSNTVGTSNTALGDSALHDNTSGFGNAAVGNQALTANTTGFSNTAVGDTALRYNTTGWSNVAVGEGSLGISNGAGNTGIGDGAMFFSTTGNWNTAVGNKTLAFNSTGSFNTALGYSALNQNTTGTYNIGIGAIAGLKLGSGSHNIEIANQGTPNDSGTIRIGTRALHHDTYIAGINGTTVAGGVGVIIDANGHLGTVTSSARYKEAIKPMDKSSEAVLSLKPVTFHYKKELDSDAIPQFGLVAEDVAKVDPDLVERDDEGKPYTVRYEAVNAMLLNEFLKEHKKVEELEKQLQEVTARLDAKGL